jgi:hypothetical protein
MKISGKYAHALFYILLSCIFSLMMAGAALLDMKAGFGIYIFDLIAKLIIIVGILVYASRKRIPLNTPGSRILSPWLAAALIPALANTINTFCVPNHFPGTVEVINLTTTMLSTAIWEEMYFRYVGRTLFEVNGKYSIGAAVLLSLGFGFPHLINIFFYEPVSVLFQVLSASIGGVFFLALYRHTGSLRLTILGHFFQNIMARFFETFTTEDYFALQTGNRSGLIVMLLCNMIELMVGLYILKKHKYIAV